MKLKRYIGLIMAAAVLLCTASFPVSAAGVLEPFFYDFEDCTTNSYGVIGKGSWQVPTGNTIDEEHGKSLVSNVTSPNNMMNLYLTLKENATTVFGFSVYVSGTATGRTLMVDTEASGKGSHKLMELATNISCMERDSTIEKTTGWYHMVFAFNKSTGKSCGWLNGQQVPTWYRDWSLSNVERFQFYIQSSDTTDNKIAFDDMFLYYLDNNMASGDTKVEPDATNYTVNMNQKIFGTDAEKQASVKIYKEGSDTPISGEGTLAATGYNDKVTVPLNERLEPGTTYTVKISGVKTAYAQELKQEFTFQTAPRYAVNVFSENSAKGSAEKVTEGELFAEGAKVRVQANAEEGYKFVGWGGLEGKLSERQRTENPLTFTVPDYDVNDLTALFEEDTSPAPASTIPFFYDMENVAVGSPLNSHGYVNGMKDQWGDKIVTGEMAKGSGNENNHGRSLIVQPNGYVNFGTELKKNAVMGISAYVDENSYFICNSMTKNDGADGKQTTTIGDMLKVQKLKLSLKGSTNTVDVPKGWNDFCVAFDYGTHTVTLWMNGQKCYTWTDDRDTKFTKTEYFNLNNRNFDWCTEIALDDFYLYYAADAVPKGVDENGVVEPDIDEYVVDMGGRIFAADKAAAAVIKDIDGNVVSGDCTIKTDGYKNLISIPITSALEPAETYTVSFVGVQDAFGAAVTKEITFQTRDTNPKVSISCSETDMVQAGTTVSLTLAADNLDAKDEVEVYCNGEKVQTLKPSDKTFSITLAAGENKIYAKSKNKGVTSEEIVLKAFEYNTTSTFCDVDFEDEDDLTDIGGTDSDGTREVIDIGGEHKHVLKMTLPQGKSASPYIWASATANKNGIVTYEADYYFVTKVNFNLFPVHNGTEYAVPFSVNQCVLTAFGEEVMTFETEKWYHIKVMYDTINDTASLYVNGEPKVSEKKNTLDKKWTQITRCSVGFHSKAQNDYIWYMDNLKTSMVTKPYTFTISETVPYENGNVTLTFSEPMKEDALSGITVTDANGAQVTPKSAAYDSDTRTYTLTMGTLLPNAEYTVTVPDSVKTTLGQGGVGTTATFMTEKAPFAIDSVGVWDTASERNITVRLQNKSDEKQVAQAVICLYRGNKLADVRLVNVDTTKSLRAKGSFSSDYADCTVEVYLIDTLPQIPFAKTDVLKCIDFHTK